MKTLTVSDGTALLLQVLVDQQLHALEGQFFLANTMIPVGRMREDSIELLKTEQQKLTALRDKLGDVQTKTSTTS